MHIVQLIVSKKIYRSFDFLKSYYAVKSRLLSMLLTMYLWYRSMSLEWKLQFWSLRTMSSGINLMVSDVISHRTVMDCFVFNGFCASQWLMLIVLPRVSFAALPILDFSVIWHILQCYHDWISVLACSMMELLRIFMITVDCVWCVGCIALSL